VFDEAKRLINIGLPIIPLCSHDHSHMLPAHIQQCKCPGKRPIIKNWQVRQTTTEEHLQEWIQQFKKFNIGLPLGEASGYCGIDIDGEKGEEFLFQMSNGNIPETWEFTTGAGRRLLYIIPPGTKTKKFKQSANFECTLCGYVYNEKITICPVCKQRTEWKTADAKHQECALLCTGQQTVLPPSIHYTGREYTWLEDRSPWDLDCAIAPNWLIDLIKIDETKEKTASFSLDLTKVNGNNHNFSNEFEAIDFSDEVPDVSDDNPAIVKVQNRGKSGHNIVVTDEMLTQIIPEGQRDNTMTAIVGHYCSNRDLRRIGKQLILQICLRHNQQYCDPPLDDESISQKVNYFFEAEQMKDAKYKDQKKDKPQFEASKMAAIVKNRLQEDNIILHFDQNSKMYYFTTPANGPWLCTRNITSINKWIRSIITNPTYGHASWDKQGYVDETRKALEELYTEAFKQFDDFDIGAHADKLSKYIIINDGMLDWKTGQILPWDFNYFTTVSYDVDYDPTADCPRFKKYLCEWLPVEDTRRVVQEYVGYCLIPNTKFRKALFLYGKGKNGKSMLLEFLQDFFGDHKATLSYDGLFQRFGPANLKGKLVNIFDDTTVTFAKDTGIIKNLIAGGMISAEFKGKDHFTFTNVARFIFSAQETPKTSDHSDAWYDRWIFVKFPNKFRPSNEKKMEIQTALQEERSGIFNWMVEGLRRLMSQDGFTMSTELLISSQEYRQQNDSVAMFIGNMCQENNTGSGGTSLHTLYKIYCVWSEFEGLRPLSKRTFTERIEDLGYRKSKGYVGGKSGQTFIAELLINKECEDYKENAMDYSIALSV
jgi:P4 family phage/plasmid primase-like protien